MTLLTTEQKTEIMDALDRIRPFLKPGVIITHTRCLGILEEHHFTEIIGNCICGSPTINTVMMRQAAGCGGHMADDISARNVTHINRQPIEMLLEEAFKADLEPPLNAANVVGFFPVRQHGNERAALVRMGSITAILSGAGGASEHGATIHFGAPHPLRVAEDYDTLVSRYLAANNAWNMDVPF